MDANERSQPARSLRTDPMVFERDPPDYARSAQLQQVEFDPGTIRLTFALLALLLILGFFAAKSLWFMSESSVADAVILWGGTGKIRGVAVKFQTQDGKMIFAAIPDGNRLDPSEERAEIRYLRNDPTIVRVNTDESIWAEVITAAWYVVPSLIILTPLVLARWAQAFGRRLGERATMAGTVRREREGAMTSTSVHDSRALKGRSATQKMRLSAMPIAALFVVGQTPSAVFALQTAIFLQGSSQVEAKVYRDEAFSEHGITVQFDTREKGTISAFIADANGLDPRAETTRLWYNRSDPTSVRLDTFTSLWGKSTLWVFAGLGISLAAAYGLMRGRMRIPGSAGRGDD